MKKLITLLLTTGDHVTINVDHLISLYTRTYLFEGAIVEETVVNMTGPIQYVVRQPPEEIKKQLTS